MRRAIPVFYIRNPYNLSPIGPDYVDDEITHVVLGILKAAEYTCVRR
jgi:hypothetical protein